MASSYKVQAHGIVRDMTPEEKAEVDAKELAWNNDKSNRQLANIRELRNIIERHIILGDKYEEDVDTSNDSELTNQNVISLPLKNARKVFEKNYLQSQINRFDGNISKTASFIGMERSALHRKLKQLGLTEDLKK